MPLALLILPSHMLYPCSPYALPLVPPCSITSLINSSPPTAHNIGRPPDSRLVMKNRNIYFFKGLGKRANRPMVRWFAVLVGRIAPAKAIRLTRSVHGPFGPDGPADSNLLILGLKRVLGSRVQPPKELSDFDDSSSSLHFIIGLSLRADQTGCLH